MAVMGRPPKEVDWEQFDKLCQLQCTQEEIAAWFDMHIETLKHKCKRKHGLTFAEYFNEKRDKGKISLRRAQWHKAVHDKNPAMLIWLGKQYLNQTDRMVTQESKYDDKLVINYGRFNGSEIPGYADSKGLLETSSEESPKPIDVSLTSGAV